MTTQALTFLAVLALAAFLYTRWLKHRLARIPAPDDVAAPPEGVEAHRGVHSRVLSPGEGEAHPGPRDRVTVHYTGWTTDGEMFDSSIVRGLPATFALDRVIDGWRIGVQLMVPGEKRRFWIPADLAYGEGPTVAGPSGMLVFDIELIAIEGQ